MSTEIRNRSRLEVKVNSGDVDVIQWGVEDKRTGKVIRSASTREKARNFAKRSSNLRVVRRTIALFDWELDEPGLSLNIFND